MSKNEKLPSYVEKIYALTKHPLGFGHSKTYSLQLNH